MTVLYDIVFLIYVAFYIPLAWLKGKWHPGLNERWGKFALETEQKISSGKNIWIHAVSVGEVNVVLDIIRRLKHEFPDHHIVCSTVTRTGYQLALKRLANEAIVIFAPLDLSWVVRRYIALIKPKVYLSTETEIWPNTYTLLHKHNVPIIQINGRISDKSFGWYEWILFVTRKVLSFVNVFCMQTQLDAERIIKLGADPKKVRIVGNLKFDQRPRPGGLTRDILGYKADQPILFAGSTHPGEEQLVLDAFLKVREEFPHLQLILAPRHIERVEEVLRSVRDHGLKTMLFSQVDGHKVYDQVLIIDTIGHLASLYDLATIVFVGKSLVPGGGQNMIEPAWVSKPIIVGRFTENFRDIMQIFLRESAIRQVMDEKQFFDALILLLKNPQDANEMGKKAKAVCEANGGATEKTLFEIMKVLR